LSGRRRLEAALAGEDAAFAPLVWERLPALVHQERADWWRDPAVGQRLIADAAAIASADAMFVFAAAEGVRCSLAAGEHGDEALDSLVQRQEAADGIALVQCLHDVAGHGVIAAIPAPAVLLDRFGAAEIEVAEDSFSDLASAYLRSGADALAVTGLDAGEIDAGVARAAELAGLFGRSALGVRLDGASASAWDRDRRSLPVISESGAWPAAAKGVVITPGDVSARWTSAQLRQAGGARR
jgi:hypothetical protein